ncbi:MAG: Holliday junction branch migration protein RuvA [Candidatus Omnitrophota bacterium]|nr:Holliday junction branch migration protein RuvA [Candidatus Omnitrophota bacterium]
MISKISGKLKQKRGNSVLIEISGISYEVLIPGIVMRKISETMEDGTDITLVTYHYFQSDPSRSVPVLIGFLSEIEKEFFEKFITVSGVGPKAACRALELPFSAIADAIDKGDMAILKSLPGIGEQRAREIVAKLQGRIGKYGLIQDKAVFESLPEEEDIKQEALQVLTQLQYNMSEAKVMIEEAIGRNSGISSCEELLNEIYKHKRKKGDLKYAGR